MYVSLLAASPRQKKKNSADTVGINKSKAEKEDRVLIYFQATKPSDLFDDLNYYW